MRLCPTLPYLRQLSAPVSGKAAGTGAKVRHPRHKVAPQQPARWPIAPNAGRVWIRASRDCGTGLLVHAAAHELHLQVDRFHAGNALGIVTREDEIVRGPNITPETD